ncbi:MAG: ABC transporter substrate-binding protein [Coriobacteriales bacterium]|nr:ABC transporter substrate-binding protein [Coriobacteriales bacterium]MBQ6585731.1 ABC transporter substrate-binding protein [Coriobacteriales bacterium]
MKKRLIVLLMAAVMALAMFGIVACGNGQQDNSQPVSGGSGVGVAPAPADPAPTEITVTDAYGRSVTVPAKVERVATVGSGVRFVVYAAGQEGIDKLVAVTDADQKAMAVRPYTAMYNSQLAALPSTSNGNHLVETTVDTEAMLALQPDVIISSRSAEECDQLQAAINIPVIGIKYQAQIFSDDVYTSILVVGQVLGTSEHAQACVDALKAWQTDLSARVAGKQSPTVYVGAISYKGSKGVTGTMGNSPVLKALGVTNVSDAAGQNGSFDTTLEQVGQWNADYMFLDANNATLVAKDYADNTAFFNQLKAVQDGNVYFVPPLNNNGTSIELGVCSCYAVGKVLYPDAFADVDLDKQFDEIFLAMDGKTFNAQLKEAGLGFSPVTFN